MALGAPEVLRRGVGAPLAGLKKKSKRGGKTKKKIGESTITFLVFRTIPRGFLCVLTTPRRTQFSTLETKMRRKSFGKKRP
jgi:hypothetical protein